MKQIIIYNKIYILEYTPMSKMISNEEVNKSKKSKKIVTDEEIKRENDENEEDDVEDSNLPISPKEYDYLLSMPLLSLSQERVDSLLKQKESKKNEIMVLEKMRVEEIWINDIEEFISCLNVNSKFFIIILYKIFILIL